MQSFIFAANATFPIIIIVAIGYLCRRVGLIDSELTKKLNKICFRLFLPIMLFVNVSAIDSSMNIGAGYIIFGCIATLVVFAIALIIVPLISKRGDVRAVLTQATFRSNFALIGIPLSESLFGTEGAAIAALLSAFSIPLFNVLAILSFSFFYCFLIWLYHRKWLISDLSRFYAKNTRKASISRGRILGKYENEQNA